jgi:hexokinase
MSGFNPKDLADFARYYGFHYDGINAQAMVRDFCIEAERGLRGEASSLPMIPSRLSPVTKPPAHKTVIALDAGGTNLRAARVHFDEQGRPVAEALRKGPMPGTRGHQSAKEFYHGIAALCAPLFEGAGNIEGMGFCFSYPMEMTEDGDGLPLPFTKELDVPGAVGKPIGRGLRDALAALGVKAPEHITLLNDTTATLLSGIAGIPPRFRDETADEPGYGEDVVGVEGGPVIGFILGTGTNVAYPVTSIPKIHFESKDRPQIVVAESGNFTFRYRGALDNEIDAKTKNPGCYTNEKASAGAYLGPLTLHILKRAALDGVLRFKKSAALLALPSLQTLELNEFLNNPLALKGPLGSLFDRDERDALASTSYLASIISERAALLAAVIIAGAVEHINAGFDPHAPVRIAVEGTTYIRYFQIRKALCAHLHRLLSAHSPRYYIISPVEQASLFGGAVGGCLWHLSPGIAQR